MIIKESCSAVEYLIEYGHRKIAHISGLFNTATGSERAKAYFDAIKNFGLQIPVGYVIETKYIEQQGFIAMEKLLSLKDRSTAVFYCNDMTAIGAYKALAKRGYIHCRI